MSTANTATTGFEPLWTKATQVYEQATGRILANDDTFAKITNLEELQKTLASQEKEFVDFRAQHKHLADKLSLCFTPLVPLLDLASKAIGATPYAPVSVAFGATAHLVRACATVTKSYDSIEELFEQVGNVTIRFESYQGDSTEESLRAKITSILAYILEIVGQAEKLVKRGRFKQWARSVFVQDDEIGEALAKLRRFIDGELGLVTALTYARVGETQGDVRGIAEKLDEVKLSVEQSNQALAQAKQEALSQADEGLLSSSLAPETLAAVDQKHVHSLKLLAPDTGLWIHDEESFKAWLNGNFPIFWVLGRPGTGKTILAAHTYETLKASNQQSVSIAYFKDDISTLQSSESLLKSTAHQIGRQNKAFQLHALEALKQRDSISGNWSFWDKVFVEYFARSTNAANAESAVIVIDGVDEASQQERSHLFSCLAGLVKESNATQVYKLRVVLFTRQDVFADPGFRDLGIYSPANSLTITAEKNSDDIKTYIERQIKGLEILRRHPKRKAIARNMYKSISSRAEGMFKWVSLVFDQIPSHSPESILKTVQECPQGLDEMIHHTLKKLATDVPATQTYLRDILLWVLGDNKEITIAELFLLLRLTIKESCYMLEDDLRWKFFSIFELHEQRYANKEPHKLENVMATSQSPAWDLDFLDGSDDDEDLDLDGHSISGTEPDSGSTTSRQLPIANSGNGDIPVHWEDFKIKFAHARIREFLQTEVGPQSQMAKRPIYLESSKLANHRFFRAILDLQYAYATAPVCTAGFYLKYTYGWHFEIKDLDLSDEFSSETTLLAQSLANLFMCGEAMMKWAFISPNRFVILSFFGDDNLLLIQQLLVKHTEALTTEQQSWVQQVQESVRALFKPMADVCARMWLERSGWDDEFYVKWQVDEQDAAVILCAYDHLCANPLAQEEADGGPEDRYYNTKVHMTAAQIQQTAESLTLPRTAHWYTCVGWAILTTTPVDLPKPADRERATAAIACFEKAIEIDSEAWPAHAGLGQCHGAGLEDYAKGIKSFQDAIAILLKNENLATMVTRLQAIIGTWSLHDKDTAVKTARAALYGLLSFPYPRDLQARRLFSLAIRNYIQAMCNVQQFEEIEKLCDGLSKYGVEQYSKTIWACFLEDWRIDDLTTEDDLTSGILDLFETAPNVNALVALIQRGVAELDYPGYGIQMSPISFWATTNWFQWLYEHSEPADDYLTMCVKFLKGYEGGQYVARDWHQMTSFMAATYLKRAITAHHAGSDYTDDIAQLRDLSSREHHLRPHPKAHFANSLYGLWCHEFASPPPTAAATTDDEWKALIRPSITEALKTLAIEDPFKRQSAYCSLGESLLRAGDLSNAHIALGITLHALQSYQAAKARGEAVPPVLSSAVFAGFYVLWHCDANCETATWDYEEIWFCRMCYNTNFCGSCVKKVREGTIERCHCSKDHDIVQGYPLTEEAKAMVDDIELGRTERFDAWLEGVKRKWQ